MAPTPHTGALAEAKLLPLERKLQFGSFYDSPDAREAGAEWVCLDFGCLTLLRLVEREAPPQKDIVFGVNTPAWFWIPRSSWLPARLVASNAHG